MCRLMNNHTQHIVKVNTEKPLLLTADGLLSVGRKTLKILCHVLGACGRGFFLIWGLRPRTKTPVW